MLKRTSHEIGDSDLFHSQHSTIPFCRLALVLALVSLFKAHVGSASAATTIDTMNRFTYGANIGWMDWRGDINHGAVIGEYVCSGYVYSANVGWINLGSGSPTNGVQYLNTSPDDFGVNLDASGNLRGYAWGANIGWINFEAIGAPKLDIQTGAFSGYAYSANCGWISLSNFSGFAQTDTIAPGVDSDGNGLPDGWEIQELGGIGANPNADPDHDGASNWREYIAGTNPNDSNDVLRITRISHNVSQPGITTMHWTSVPTRAYIIQLRSSLTGTGSWLDLVSPAVGVGSATFDTEMTNDLEFYRIRAYRPLGP